MKLKKITVRIFSHTFIYQHATSSYEHIIPHFLFFHYIPFTPYFYNLIFCADMKHLPIHNTLFTNNRRRFIAEMKPNSIAIFNSNDEMPSNGDALYRFVQNSDLYWLTGIEQEDTMVVLYPDNPDPKYR